MDTVRSFVRLTRAEFLLGGFALFWMGTRAAGPISPRDYLIGQGLVTSIQLVAQYANEYFDVDADSANPNRTWFSGGSGVLAAGRLSALVALNAAKVAAAAAIAFGVFATAIDWRIGAIGVVALAGSWWYSAPPYRLVASGFGEVTVAVVVGGLTPLTGALTAGSADGRLLASFVVPTMLTVLALLMAVHTPDVTSDARVAKRTLPVRLGDRTSALVHRSVSVLVLVAVVVLAPWRPAASTVLAGLAVPSLLAAAWLVYPAPHGMRAHLLTLSAVASLALLAIGLGLGTLE